MYGLVNRAIEELMRKTHGDATWEDQGAGRCRHRSIRTHGCLSR